MQLIPWHSIVLKARHLLIFNTDFCIEYFPQTRFEQRLVSSKIQTAPFAVPLRKISLIFSGTVRTFKLLGELWMKSLLISTLYLETTQRISDFLGLKSDTCKLSLQINFCFLLARHYIWGCRTCNRTPQLKMFLKTLHSQYKIESNKQVSANNPTNKKWDPLVPLFNGNC